MRWYRVNFELGKPTYLINKTDEAKAYALNKFRQIFSEKK